MAAEATSLRGELELLTKRIVESKDGESLRLALLEMTAYLDKRLADHDKAADAKKFGT